MLLTIEKVLILKSVEIFSETPEEILTEMASILDEIIFEKGKTIIEKDEIGRSLYIIIDGEVKVHDGDQILTTLGERKVFGELAVLDDEPRTASVTALCETNVFRLKQDDLYDLMAEHVEISRSIIQVLCQRLRSPGSGDS